MSLKKRIHQQLNYQGSKKQEYFEGWYFKQVSADTKSTISFIPGISLAKDDPHAFVQVINNINYKTYYIRYKLSEFESGEDPFFVKVGKNEFHENRIHIDIDDQVKIVGDIVLGPFTPIDTTTYSPNIMGPFAYLPGMECVHAVLSLHHPLQGTLQLNEHEINLDQGTGYLEKDYGISFPSRYIWIQSNTALLKNASLFFSYATIPLKVLRFEGLICILEIRGKQYRFATYHRVKVKKVKVGEQEIYIELVQKHLCLKIQLTNHQAHPLKAPVKGKMNNTILESLSSHVNVSLYENKKLIFQDDFLAAGSEVFGNFK